MGPQLKVVERTRTATMLCAASGNPDPDISWFKDFLPVNTSNNNGRIKQLRSGLGEKLTKGLAEQTEVPFCDFSRATQEVETWFDAYIFERKKEKRFSFGHVTPHC
ncbi:receptor-type tyrosine-protein phosphatase delta isoform X5 [Tachysurus ichikawai]